MHTPTTRRGKQLEAVAALRNTRRSLIALHDQLDLNSDESNELARVITEIGFALARLGETSEVID